MNQEMLLEPTAEDLAEKLSSKLKAEKDAKDKKEAVATIRSTSRNGDCPCGCGRKAKKCENGRRVIQFKHMFRGGIIVEVLLTLLSLAMFWFTFHMASKKMAKTCEDGVETLTVVYDDTVKSVQRKP